MATMASETTHPRPKLPPSRDELAKLFGLEDLRIGKHFLRDADRSRVGSIWIESFWYAEILPSFHDGSALCVARAKGEVFRNNTTRDWHMAAFATTSHSAFSDIVDDPVASSLGGLNLFHADGNFTLDGIGYKVSFETLNLRGCLDFSNPTQPSLVSLESTLNLVAAEVAQRSGVQELIATIRTWDEYAGNRLRR
jgi:hypothetical protein